MENIKREYWIGTGEHDVYYTLWVTTEITLTILDTKIVRTISQYLQNLSIDKNPAVEKAAEITGENLTPRWLKGNESKRYHFGTTELQFGKHRGEDVYELMQTTEGFDYVCWLVENRAWAKKQDGLFNGIIDQLGDLIYARIEEKTNNWKNANSELYGFLVENKKNRFYGSLLETIATIGKLTENQERAAYKSFETTKAENLENVNPAPNGRVIGQSFAVLSVSCVDSAYGSTQKMLVKHTDDNYKVWCSVPGNLDIEVGQTVKMSVTLTPKEGDKSFAWGKRPGKAQII